MHVDVDVHQLIVVTDPSLAGFGRCRRLKGRLFGSGQLAANGAIQLTYEVQGENFPGWSNNCPTTSFLVNATCAAGCYPSLATPFGSTPAVWVPVTPDSVFNGQLNNSTGYFYVDCDVIHFAYQFTNGPGTEITTRWGHIRLSRNAGACEPPACQQLGSCCCQGRCYPDLTQAQCAAKGGIFNGVGSSCFNHPCEAFGACCADIGGSPECMNILQSGCAALGGIFFEGIPCSAGVCSARGACCLPSGCSFITATECTFLGGTWHQGLPCASVNCQLGACCNTNTGTCAETTAAACGGKGMNWYGGLACSEITCVQIRRGACCTPQQTCVQNTAEECTQLGGVWFDSWDCGQVECGRGACCRPDGQCVETGGSNCTIILGGTFHGVGSVCANVLCTGTCCLLLSPCSLDPTQGQVLAITQAQCTALGGTWAPSNPTGACCSEIGLRATAEPITTTTPEPSRPPRGARAYIRSNRWNATAA
jgi:hypothetical protein